MATTYPPKVLDLTFRALIEGGKYDRPTHYEEMEVSPEFRKQMAEFGNEVSSGRLGWGNAADLFAAVESPSPEWVAVQRTWQSYPSGGVSRYPSYAYWNGHKLEVEQRNARIRWLEIQFYRVIRSEAK